MFYVHINTQFDLYNFARNQLIKNPKPLIELENYFINHLYKCIESNLLEIKADYNEASYLYPFWKNYPPDDRGRQPIMDQYPWIEVGEHAVGCKLPRLLAQSFNINDPGIPTGTDQRLLLSNNEIELITNNLTNTAWLFIDIKSVGPRDDHSHSVMSHNQISGDGFWENPDVGILNTTLKATGKRKSHNFHSSLPPLFILSNGTIAPVIIIVLKLVYSMLKTTPPNLRNNGQPLIRIDLACIPNGILLTKNPAYLQTYPQLLFPGKDDKSKDPRKLRTRVNFEILRKIDSWRYRSVQISYP